MKKASVLFLLSFALGCRATGTTLAELQQRLSGVKTVQAEFVQSKHLRMFANEMRLTGSLGLDAASGKLVWRVQKPVRYCVLFSGPVMSQWDESTDKITTFDTSSNPALKALLEQMRAWFTGDLAAMEKDYTLAVQPEDPAQPGVTTLACTPRGQMASLIQKIHIRLDKDARYIQSVRLDEVSGDWTEITFEKTRINAPVAQKIFSFEFDRKGGCE